MQSLEEGRKKLPCEEESLEDPLSLATENWKGRVRK